jgi:CBS domain-containing protein/ribosome-associated translation inhibitor RaiA
MSNLTILELYPFLKDTRNSLASNFIEPAVTANGNASISQIIGVLMEKNSNDIFIPLSGKVAALNIRDFLGVRNITSTNPATVGKIIPTLNSESRTVEAARLMSLYRLRALPLMEKNEIIGQISAKRIVRAIRDAILVAHIRKTSTSDVMTPSPIVIRETDKIASAKTIMKRKRIDHLPVVQDRRLVGMVTSKDIIEVMLRSERIGRKSLGIDEPQDRLDLAITGIADKNVLTSHVNDTLQSVTDLMVSRNSTYCVIKAFDEVQGIITYRDIITLLGEKLEEDIPIFINGLPDDPFDAELAKSKFTNIIKLLRRIYPDIEQARCRIKIREVSGARRRYEIDAHVFSTHGAIVYTRIGWDLAKIFDEMSDALKKKVSHRYTRRQRESIGTSNRLK